VSSAAAPAPASDPNVPVRRRLHVTGVVQGVGFRPFVHRLARREALGGWVRNEGWGVVIEVEGEAPALDAFARALLAEAPLLARVDAVAARLVVPRGECAFSIGASAAAGALGALVPPDVATCGDCLRELWDPADRRYRYRSSPAPPAGHA
jgi:hydrogenase maturation protein HypF